MSAPAPFLLQEAALLHRRGDLAGAAARYRQVLALDKRNVAATFGLATIHCQQGELSEGIALARSALKLAPKFAPACNLIGLAQHRLGRAELALNQLDRAVALDPRFTEAWLNRGHVLNTLGRREHALESFTRAIALAPEQAAPRHARGVVLMLASRDAEALSDLDAAIARDPNCVPALTSRFDLLNRLGRFEPAFADLARARALAPDDDDVRYHAALVELLHGKWRDAWPKYEARLTAPSLDSARRFVAPPFRRWRGEPPDGSLLALFTEQGRGDVIQFARFAVQLGRAGHRVALVTQPDYASIFADLPAVERVITDFDELATLGPLRWQMLVSVAGILDVTPDTVPGSTPYLAAQAQRSAAWRTRLGAGFKVGISWQGSPGFVHDRGRSIPLAAFAPLAELPTIRLISLQKRPGAEQIDSVPFGPRIEQVLDPSDTGADAFRETAALVASLDLVVASDSMNAHLAGALGRPTCLALRRIPDWRWLLEREDCPWYPTMRLFRQRSEGDWQDVFSRIATAVHAAAAVQP